MTMRDTSKLCGRSLTAGAALIALVVFAVYLPALSGGFIMDDATLLTANPLIPAADGLYRMWFTTEATDYWPVSNSSFWLEWRLWGMNPAGYHVTNVLLHGAASVLIWVILARLALPGAFLAAVLFAVHPVNVESVAWIAQRKGLLALLFSLLAALAYLRSPGFTSPAARPERFYWLSLVCFVLAMLSKGSAAVLPALVWLMVCWRRAPTRFDLVRLAPFFLIDAALIWVNVWFQTHGGAAIRSAGWLERLLAAAAGVWFYLYKAIIPLNLIFVYPKWQVDTRALLWWLPLLAAMAVSAVLWAYRRRWRGAWLAWVYFCVALLPALGFSDVGFMRYSLVADHYQYFAIIGVLALMAAGWAQWRRRARVPANAAAIVVTGLLAWLSWRQSSLYLDEMTLYTATLRHNPQAGLVQGNLGAMLAESGRVGEAIRHYREALRVNPSDAVAHNNLAAALHDRGYLPAAIEHYEAAVRLSPGFVQAHNNLGNALYQAGRIDDAIQRYERVLSLQPAHAAAHNNLSIALTARGRMHEALAHSQEALRLKPRYPEAHNSLGKALALLGRRDEAIAQFQQALKLRPELADARRNLAAALSATPN